MVIMLMLLKVHQNAPCLSHKKLFFFCSNAFSNLMQTPPQSCPHTTCYVHVTLLCHHHAYASAECYKIPGSAVHGDAHCETKYVTFCAVVPLAPM